MPCSAQRAPPATPRPRRPARPPARAPRGAGCAAGTGRSAASQARTLAPLRRGAQRPPVTRTRTHFQPQRLVRMRRDFHPHAHASQSSLTGINSYRQHSHCYAGHGGGCNLHLGTPANTWRHAFRNKAHLKDVRVAARVQRGVSSAAKGNRVAWCRQPPRNHIVQFLLGRRAKPRAAPQHRAAQQQDHKVSYAVLVEKYQAAGHCDITHEQPITNEQETCAAHTCRPQSCRC